MGVWRVCAGVLRGMLDQTSDALSFSVLVELMVVTLGEPP